MNDPDDLPEPRPMPESLRNRLWAEIEPQLETRASGSRSRMLRAPSAVAASVVALAVGLAIVLPQFRDRGQDNVTGAGSPGAGQPVNPGDLHLVRECVQAGQDVPDPASWRPGVRFDLDAENGFLVIRSDEYAAVCVLKNGKATRIEGGVDTRRHVYGDLTAARPFDYLSSWNWGSPVAGSVHFGIVTSEVTAVSLVGPDNSVTPAVVRDGTFAAKTKFAESSGQPTTNHIRATLKDGQVIEGPFR
ncbi:hypothetical protein GCM10022222_09300 [Amycolatopsis ultiminotia]|uniref:Uncharacterized protein n=1 Tax=Amycolatopsis ultiminotia TaxID=543629 RepID=A0ABP6V3U5_9PSEU